MASSLCPSWLRELLLGAPPPPPPPPPLMHCALAASAVLWLAEAWLAARQLRAVAAARAVPQELKGLLAEDKFVKGRVYALDRGRFGLLSSAVDFALGSAALWLGALPWAWAAGGELATAIGLEGEAWRSVCFVVLWELLEGAVALPFSAYRTFVIEARHGMNTQTAMTFVLDTIKSLLLLLLLAPPLVTLLVRVLRLGGPLMPLYAWGVVASLQVVMMTLYPVLIAPLFNKFAPLQSGSLKQAVEALASKVGFPLARLQVVDGSKRSAHSNAYMYGFWRSKRIVLYDTLLSQLTESEVVAVLAHELGHWKLGHTLKMALVGQAVLVAQLLAYTLVRDWADLYRAFGFEDFRQGDAMPVLVGLVLFQHLLIPLALPLTLVTNGASRRHEFQADDFAASMGMGPQLRSSLLVLQEENLSTGVVDPWFAWFAYSHPALPERLRAIKHAETKYSKRA